MKHKLIDLIHYCYELAMVKNHILIFANDGSMYVDVSVEFHENWTCDTVIFYDSQGNELLTCGDIEEYIIEMHDIGVEPHSTEWKIRDDDMKEIRDTVCNLFRIVKELDDESDNPA